jgi:N-methylhydantoinase A
MVQLAGQMGMSAEQAALGMVRLTNTNCDRALRQVSVARGHDPRDFTLVAFGGAGPLHACEIAAGLDMPRVLVPRYPGVLCALGLLMADVAIESSRAVLALVSPEVTASLRQALVEMEAQACADLAQEGVAEQDTVLIPLVDARYQGQSYELTIPLGEDVSEGFHAAHANAYGHAMPDRAVEIVNLRLHAIGKVAKPRLKRDPEQPDDARPAHLGQKPIVCDGKARQADLYDRAKLYPGARFEGPALVFQMDSTTYLPPNWHARVDGYHNLILEPDNV